MKSEQTKEFSKGFALVVSLSMLVLLTIIAMGLLSLSSISVRASSQSSAMLEAQANARLALVIAIGELQRYTGPDTRVTAPATIVDENYPQVLGVWRSWEGTNHDTTNGRPISPDYAAKEQSVSSGGRFVDWLVSSAAMLETPGIDDAPTLVQNSESTNTVPLLSDGSLKSSDPRQIHVVPTELDNGGRMAWWVSGENQKARISQPYLPRTNNAAGLTEMGQSHSVPNPEVFGLESLLNDQENYIADPQNPKLARKAFTRATTELIASGNNQEPNLSFHDLSTTATGLLTNTATGGWRKDLSTLTEKWDQIYTRFAGNRLPLFRYLPMAERPGGSTAATSSVPKPTPTALDPNQSNLYPWSNYSTIIGARQPNTHHAASASWQSLVNYVTTYKNLSFNGDTAVSPFVWDEVATRRTNLADQKIYNFKHTQRLHPQIARFQFLVYAMAVEDPTITSYNPGVPTKYRINIKYVPIFTLWNPYNITLEQQIGASEWLGFGFRRSLPGVMAIVNQRGFPDPDSVPLTNYRLFTPGNFQVLDAHPGQFGNNANPYDNRLPQNIDRFNPGAVQVPIWMDRRTFGCWLPSGTLRFRPGEVKVFSPDIWDNTYNQAGVIRLREGYLPGGSPVGIDSWNGNPANANGLITPNGTPGGPAQSPTSGLQADQSIFFLFRPDRVTQPYLGREPGMGFSLSFGNAGASPHFGGGSMPTGIGDELHNQTALVSIPAGDNYWPTTEVDEVPYIVGSLVGAWRPVFSVSFGPRMTIGSPPLDSQNRPTKGLVQNNPLASIVLSDPTLDPPTGSNTAKDHPVNGAYDFTYHSIPDGGSFVTPNPSPSEGFIATGFNSGNGLSRLILAEIPLRPIASLVELNGWNPRGNNPYPPFQMNLIGNSDATPLIPNDNIAPPILSPSTIEHNLMHDDAYCANHLLFDDWFVSSIAPQPQAFGNNIARNIERVYQDFLTGSDKLTNRNYTPIIEDRNLSISEATALTDQIINSPAGDGWLKVASRLEVEGMFNVNSTSVDAWRALLGQAKSRERVAIYGANGIETAIPSEDHPVTRGAIASDVEASSGEAHAGGSPSSSEFAGFRSLSDDQIDDLAEKIVEQVRLRGPFLSLAEFVNRQLTDDDDSMALAGAVQTALNNLSDDPMATLRNDITLSDATMAVDDDKLTGAGYEFPAASQGVSSYGVPGWIRQADILRPIAPILSVRDDTFTIRTYGDARDNAGKVIARAWCEAVVTRTRDYSDSSDDADTYGLNLSTANFTFGRKYKITSFRWLNQDEV